MASIEVHRTRCCEKHGCKYGESDCPVDIGMVEQDYPCEECDDTDGLPAHVIADQRKGQENLLKWVGATVVDDSGVFRTFSARTVWEGMELEVSVKLYPSAGSFSRDGAVREAVDLASRVIDSVERNVG